MFNLLPEGLNDVLRQGPHVHRIPIGINLSNSDSFLASDVAVNNSEKLIIIAN